jgi:hypothetical protein
MYRNDGEQKSGVESRPKRVGDLSWTKENSFSLAR